MHFRTYLVAHRAARLLFASLIGAASLSCAPSPSFRAQPTDLRPVDAQSEILSAFDEHRVVGIGDNHGCQELYDWISSFLYHPRLPGKVNDIVVEFGNALYQDVVDRYIAGDDVSVEALNQVWRNHTNPIVFDSPIYENFLRTVREINGTLPAPKRFRVLLGDPPIDWSRITTNREWGRVLVQRDSHFAAVVENEVLAKGRSALLWIGGAHLVRGITKGNVTDRLESRRPGSVFVVIPHSGFKERNQELEARFATWKTGSLARLNNSWLGALHPRLRWPQLKDAKLAREGRTVDATIEDVADAWLYVGPRDLLTEALPFPGIYRDEYWNELQRRHIIMWGTPLSRSSGAINTSGKYYVTPR